MSALIDKEKSYAKGGAVTSTGPAFLHKGEKVIPAKKGKGKKSSMRSSGMKR